MVPSYVEFDHLKLMDFTNYTRLPLGPAADSHTTSCTGDTSSKQTSRVNSHGRDREDAGERESDIGKTCSRSVSFVRLSRAQEERRRTTNYQFAPPQQIHCISSLQDGRHLSGEGPLSAQ